MTHDASTPSEAQPSGLSRRTVLTRGAIGAGVIWAAPAITTLGGSAFAATGSPSPTRSLVIHYFYAGNDYEHDYTITVDNTGAFTGTGTSLVGPHPETISGNLSPTSLTYHAIYTDTNDYYDVVATVSGNTVTGGTGSVNSGNFPATNITGTIS